MDYSLVDDTANVMAFTSSTYKFYGATGLTLATIDSSTKNITITGNIFGNAGTLQGNAIVGNSVYAGTIGNTGASLVGTIATAAQPSITSVGNLSASAINNTPIGNAVASSGAFTTLTSSTNMISTGAFYSNGTTNISSANISYMTANTIAAGTIGNSGALLYGTINTASQPNITGLGTLTALQVSGTIGASIHAGALNGPHNGTVGASTPNTGAFTTLTTTGDVTIAGNLTINGNSTVINANNITINDTILYLANSNPANSYELGIVGQFTAGTRQFTGVLRDHNNNNWTFFSNVSTANLQSNVITFDSNTTYDTIRVGGIVWGNGTSFADSVGGYGNIQVASYLTTYRSALTANNFNATAVYAGTIGNTGASLQGATIAVTGASTANSYTAISVSAGTIGNTGATLTGTLSTAAQTNITSLGTLTSLGVSGAITVNSTSGVTAIANGGTNGIGNIGTSSTGFNTVFAKSTSAQYADLAECYIADAAYAPGTVIDFGGDNEVTLSVTDASRRVAGVVTTNPAYLMNSHLEAEFVAAIALQGRVPTLVQGLIVKGDTMVSAGNGRARAEADPLSK
jgi:hypothetical protein